ncbi:MULTISPECIES: PsbP-related protein [unclassified Leptolyngbya]|uniref:PsbP-related protein n=1 Tax=unclassified Leptolyngbya TaxID=2650499 RepID=UPI0016865C3F|nr:MULTISPECIES: PsbP-related protein [unclassified Leptolyngbya]MBD1911113.1 hypothetical protein [Leptolyngbya sp. FACHB-8]MBD2153975.1 hypothetical protein [Leptolyngbya sp. FACHB-16]
MYPEIIVAIALLIPRPLSLPMGPTTQVSAPANLLTTTKAQVSTQRFSITYPDHWMITQQSTDFLIIFNQPLIPGGGYAPPYMIKTDIGIQPFPMEESLRGRESGERMPSEFGETPVSRRMETVVVNEREAVRVWQDGGETFRNIVITYIPVSDRETAYLSSFYNVQNQAAEAAILQVHNSFEFLK